MNLMYLGLAALFYFVADMPYVAFFFIIMAVMFNDD